VGTPSGLLLNVALRIIGAIVIIRATPVALMVTFRSPKGDTCNRLKMIERSVGGSRATARVIVIIRATPVALMVTFRSPKGDTCNRLTMIERRSAVAERPLVSS
jgi:hypothetical protein